MKMQSAIYVLLIVLGVVKIDGLPFAGSEAKSYPNVMLGRAVPDCYAWYLLQGDPNKLLAQTLKPPCSIPPQFPRQLAGGWSVDPECDAAKQPDTCQYHQGAYGCYRHAYTSTGPGAQACYDRNGRWISDPWRGAGTLDKETPLGDIIQQGEHFLADVAPFYSCCRLAVFAKTSCNWYYEKRPPGQCENKPAI